MNCQVWPCKFGFIADMFTWDGLLDIPDEPHQQRDNEPSDLVEKRCFCEGPSCNCCVDFNLTYIDLGGPGKLPPTNEV